MDESHADFMDRVWKMSSATHRVSGFDPRANTASKMNAISGQAKRRAQHSDIRALLALGRKDSEIAEELGIAEDTVRTLRVSRM